MKTTLNVIILSMLAAVSALAQTAQTAQTAPTAAKKASVAIYGVKATPALAQKIRADNRTDVLERVVQAMDSQLASAITDTRKFNVVARSDWNSLLREQDFGQSGNVDPSTAAKVGKMTGATYILETTVDDFQDYLETATFATLGKTAQKRIIRYGAVAKLYDASTGVLAETVNTVITNDDVAELPSYSVRNGNLNDALIGDIARLMAKNIASRISDVAFPAKVLSVIGSQIIINRGDGAGVRVGDVYKVSALGEAMIDPDTGENLGSAEADIGVAIITEVNPKFSKATLKENFGVEKGNIARKVSSADAVSASLIKRFGTSTSK